MTGLYSMGQNWGTFHPSAPAFQKFCNSDMDFSITKGEYPST